MKKITANCPILMASKEAPSSINYNKINNYKHLTNQKKVLFLNFGFPPKIPIRTKISQRYVL
jgi:hypothetical protein